MFSQSPTYNLRHAWLRALAYFAACFGLSALVGVLPALVREPLVTPAQLADPSWLAFTALCLSVIFVGYYIIWPKGTLTHGRALHWPTVIGFGLLWGLSEGQLFLSIFALCQRLILSPVWATLAAFTLISAFIGVWHQFYWDIYVAPDHNIPEWNAKKVLFAHIPNLIVTLTYLTLYSNGGLFVLFQTMALVGSTYFMRFPPFPFNSR